MTKRIVDKLVTKDAVAVSAGANAGIPIVGVKIDGTGFSRARFTFKLGAGATTASLVTGLGVWNASTSGATFALITGASAAAITSGLLSGGANNIVEIDVPIAAANPWLQLSGSIGQTGAAHTAQVDLYSGVNLPPTTASQQVVVV